MSSLTITISNIIHSIDIIKTAWSIKSQFVDNAKETF